MGIVHRLGVEVEYRNNPKGLEDFAKSVDMTMDQIQQSISEGMAKPVEQVDQQVKRSTQNVSSLDASVAGFLGGITAAVTTKILDVIQSIPQAAINAMVGFTDAVWNAGLRAENELYHLKAVYGDTADYIMGRADEISNGLGGTVGKSTIANNMAASGMAFKAMGFGSVEAANIGGIAESMGVITGQGGAAAAGDIEGAMASGRTKGLLKYGINLSDLPDDATDSEKRIAIYNALVAKQDDLRAAAAAYANTTQGQLDKMKNRLDDLKETWGGLQTVVQPPLKFLNDMLDKYLPKAEKWTAGVAKVFDKFSELGGVISGEVLGGIGDLGDLFDWAADNGLKLANAAYNFLDVIILIAKSGVLDGVGDKMSWVMAVGKWAWETLVAVLLWASEIILTATGIITDSHHSMGEKIRDVLLFIVGRLLDFAQKTITILGDLAKRVIDIGAVLGVEFANMIIRAVNRGIGGLVGKMNGWIDSWNNDIGNKIGKTIGNIGGFSIDEIGPVDTSGAKAVIDSLTSQAVNWIESMQTKYGANITLEQLAAKYGVDLEKFRNLLKSMGTPFTDPSTGLPALTSTLSEFKDVVAGKNMQTKFEFNLHQAFNGPVTEESARMAGQEAANAFTQELKKLGYGT